MAHWIEDDGERVWGLTDEEEAALAGELRPHAGKWVAIHTREDGSETVAGVGADMRQAKADAEGKGYRDSVLLYCGQGDTAFWPKRALTAGGRHGRRE